MSFPRSERICAAGILAKLGNLRERFPAEDQLAADPRVRRDGVCPVTHASGSERICAERVIT